MTNWLRSFIESCASITAPLTDLTKEKRGPIKWNDDASVAFKKLKTSLIKAPILQAADFNKEFVIHCDASDVGTSAVLTQSTDGPEHVITYISQKLKKAKKNYTATEKLLAVIHAIERFMPYIQGVKFTDHSASQYLRNLKNATGRLARWALKFQPFDFEVIHRKDALSRAVE